MIIETIKFTDVKDIFSEKIPEGRWTYEKAESQLFERTIHKEKPNDKDYICLASVIHTAEVVVEKFIELTEILKNKFQAIYLHKERYYFNNREAYEVTLWIER